MVVFAEVLHGHKRWFVAAPRTQLNFDPDETTLAWLQHKYDPSSRARSGILECTLSPGEVQMCDMTWLTLLDRFFTLMRSGFTAR